MSDNLNKEQEEIYNAFNSLVNMQPKELQEWLKTEKSKSVGDSPDGGESTGHESGRRIVKIKRTKKADLTEDDFDHMSKVIGYIKRHTAQRPQGDVSETNWCYSLKNWGFDPTKNQSEN